MHHHGRLTKYARMRILEITDLSFNDILDIVCDPARHVLLNTDRPGIVGKLFYSTEDERFFVAVCDEKDGTVITLITAMRVAYFRRQITKEMRGQLRRPITLVPPSHPVIRVTAEVSSGENQNQIPVWRAPSEDYLNSDGSIVTNPDDLIRNKKFIEDVREAVREHVLNKDLPLVRLYIRIGKKGPWVRVEKENLSLFIAPSLFLS